MELLYKDFEFGMKKLFNKEFILYIVFGVLTTVVSWGSYTLLVNNCKMPVFWSNLISWVCAVTFAYITNKLWVFESKSWNAKLVLKEAGSFFASRGATGVLEIVFVPILVKLSFDNLFYTAFEKMHISFGILFTEGIYSKIVVSFIIVILNYVFSKLIVFKNKAD